MKKLSIRAKITIWFSILIVLIVVMMFSLMLVIDRYVLYSDIKKTLTYVVNANAEEIEYKADISDGEIEEDDHYLPYKDGYLEIDDDFLIETQGVYTALLDDTGKILHGRLAAEVPVNRSDKLEIQTVGKEKYYVYSKILKQGKLSGIIIQGMANENANETLLTRTVGLCLLLLPLLAVIAIIGGYLLAGRLLNPVRQIIDAAENINDGTDLSQRITLGSGKDELHQLVHSFNRMFMRLEQSFENEKQFTSDISHELRTPVSVILAQTEVILGKDRTKKEYKDALCLIQRQGIYMQHLVNEMLQYSRLERMETLPDAEEIDLSGLVEMVVQEHQLNDERGIKLIYEITPEIELTGNVELMIRMLHNLLSNAYRYGKKNGHIWVRLCENHNTICLSVKDDGVGIGSGEKDKIFRHFYQVDQSRGVSKESLGLGLAIVTEIARLHQAKIEVESNLGEGSEFIVTFLKK